VQGLDREGAEEKEGPRSFTLKSAGNGRSEGKRKRSWGIGERAMGEKKVNIRVYAEKSRGNYAAYEILRFRTY